MTSPEDDLFYLPSHSNSSLLEAPCSENSFPVWKRCRQDAVLSSLIGSSCDVENYLSSITCLSWPIGGPECIDPSVFQLPGPSTIPQRHRWIRRTAQNESQPHAQGSPDEDATTSTQWLDLEGSNDSPESSDFNDNTAFSRNSHCTPDHDTLKLSARSASGSASATNSVGSSPNYSTNSMKTHFACKEKGCSKQFSSYKDLNRHFDSLHGRSFFRCRCGKKNARKDNHERHVIKCRRPSIGWFYCRCGQRVEAVQDHLQHIIAWNMRSGCCR